jgi:hypothetical protein
MGRIHLFEWEDQPWLAQSLRDFVTYHLRFTLSSASFAPMHLAVANIVLPLLARSGTSHIVDTCSGGGGLWSGLLPILRERSGRDVTVRMTDLYPNAMALGQIERESGGAITFSAESVSAFDVPAELGVFQTMFTAFHHFRPDDARAVLADACAKRRTILVVEPYSQKDAVGVALGSLISGILLTPFIPGMGWKRFLWTYPIPLSAAVLAWDGVVSCLRAYSVDEMMALAKSAAPHGYRWRAGKDAVSGRGSITYLVGEPDQ